MELAEGCIQWQTLVLAVLNLLVLPPESCLISEMDLKEIGCEYGTWMELVQNHISWWAFVLVGLNLCCQRSISFVHLIYLEATSVDTTLCLL